MLAPFRRQGAGGGALAIGGLDLQTSVGKLYNRGAADARGHVPVGNVGLVMWLAATPDRCEGRGSAE